MAMTLTKLRRWRVWIPGPAENNCAIDVGGPEAWVKGGHLFIGARDEQWIMAWAPGGWLSIELVKDGLADR